MRTEVFINELRDVGIEIGLCLDGLRIKWGEIERKTLFYYWNRIKVHRRKLTETLRRFALNSISEKVRKIEAQAYELGWSHEQLWHTEGWYNKQGLVCFLHEGDDTGEVTEKYIEIFKKEDARGKRIVFGYSNLTVYQPWIKRNG